jgi:AbiV family abortive infection protein
MIAKNAISLYGEAVLLTEHKAWSRALFLHQISMEECAKVEVLTASAASVLMGENVSFKDVAKVFTSHESKNNANAYFLEPSAKERQAGRLGRLKESIAAFELIQERFHKRSNTEKNAALYVDLVGEDSTRLWSVLGLETWSESARLREIPDHDRSQA